MELYKYLDKKLLVVGDIHGDFPKMFHKLSDLVAAEERIAAKEDKKDEKGPSIVMDGRFSTVAVKNSVIIVAGDCGFGFNKEGYYRSIFDEKNDFLAKNGIIILFLRGNHDNPSYFTDHIIDYSNIKTIGDYSVVQTEEYCTLCVGGAISIDRTWRQKNDSWVNRFAQNTKKESYWPNEPLVYINKAIMDILKDGIQIDSVVTHTMSREISNHPIGYLSEWFKADPLLSKDISKENKAVMSLYKTLIKQGVNLKWWSYGHYHERRSYYFKGTPFIGLNDAIEITSPNTEIRLLQEIEEMSKKLKEAKMEKSKKASPPRGTLDEPFEDFVYNEEPIFEGLEGIRPPQMVRARDMNDLVNMDPLAPEELEEERNF